MLKSVITLKMSVLAVILVCILVVATLIGAAVLYTRHLEQRLKDIQDSIKEPPPIPKDIVSRNEINKVFAEMQTENQKAMNNFGKSMAALTPTRSAGSSGGGSSGGGSGTETRSIRDDLERYNTNLTNKLVEQERTLKKSILSYTTSMVQQEQLINALRTINNQQDTAINAIRSGNVQQETLTSTIRSIEDINVRQEAVIDRLIGVQQKPTLQVQPDDIAKRANLLAIAYYNALRDKTPDKKLQWDYVYKHMYICGFTNGIYKDGPLLMDVFTTILADLPYRNKSKASDVVTFLTDYLSKYIPKNNNPDGLTIFDLEKKLGNGSTMPSLATTFGALNPEQPFYPPDIPEQSLGIPRGPTKFYQPIIEDTARAQMLKDVMVVS